MMLDDIKRIAQRDSMDALGVAEKQIEQLLQAPKLDLPAMRPDHIVVCAMGGSALAARMIRDNPKPDVPFEIVQSYELPLSIRKQSLVVIISYSGNTEEEIACFEAAIEKDCNVAVITTGGELQKRAEKTNTPLVLVPGGLQPRQAVLLMYRALHDVLAHCTIVEPLYAFADDIVSFLRKEIVAWRPDQPASENLAKQLAMELAGTTPVVYAGDAFASVAYKWKINFNENSKNVAFANVLPEVNHNEMMGWVSHPVEKPFRPIELRSDTYNSRINKRFDAMNKALSGKMPHPIEVQAVGSNSFEQMLWLIILGDFVSIYLAIINNVDPTKIELMDTFKKQIAL